MSFFARKFLIVRKALCLFTTCAFLSSASGGPAFAALVSTDASDPALVQPVVSVAPEDSTAPATSSSLAEPDSSYGDPIGETYPSAEDDTAIAPADETQPEPAPSLAMSDAVTEPVTEPSLALKSDGPVEEETYADVESAAEEASLTREEPDYFVDHVFEELQETQQTYPSFDPAWTNPYETALEEPAGELLETIPEPTEEERAALAQSGAQLLAYLADPEAYLREHPQELMTLMLVMMAGPEAPARNDGALIQTALTNGWLRSTDAGAFAIIDSDAFWGAAKNRIPDNFLLASFGIRSIRGYATLSALLRDLETNLARDRAAAATDAARAALSQKEIAAGRFLVTLFQRMFDYTLTQPDLVSGLNTPGRRGQICVNCMGATKFYALMASSIGLNFFSGTTNIPGSETGHQFGGFTTASGQAVILDQTGLMETTFAALEAGGEGNFTFRSSLSFPGPDGRPRTSAQNYVRNSIRLFRNADRERMTGFLAVFGPDAVSAKIREAQAATGAAILTRYGEAVSLLRAMIENFPNGTTLANLGIRSQATMTIGTTRQTVQIVSLHVQLAMVYNYMAVREFVAGNHAAAGGYFREARKILPGDFLTGLSLAGTPKTLDQMITESANRAGGADRLTAPAFALDARNAPAANPVTRTEVAAPPPGAPMTHAARVAESFRRYNAGNPFVQEYNRIVSSQINGQTGETRRRGIAAARAQLTSALAEMNAAKAALEGVPAETQTGNAQYPGVDAWSRHIDTRIADLNRLLAALPR